jgi:hypothetical protein
VFVNAVVNGDTKMMEKVMACCGQHITDVPDVVKQVYIECAEVYANAKTLEVFRRLLPSLPSLGLVGLNVDPDVYNQEQDKHKLRGYHFLMFRYRQITDSFDVEVPDDIDDDHIRFAIRGADLDEESFQRMLRIINKGEQFAYMFRGLVLLGRYDWANVVISRHPIKTLANIPFHYLLASPSFYRRYPDPIVLDYHLLDALKTFGPDKVGETLKKTGVQPRILDMVTAAFIKKYLDITTPQGALLTEQVEDYINDFSERSLVGNNLCKVKYSPKIVDRITRNLTYLINSSNDWRLGITDDVIRRSCIQVKAALYSLHDHYREVIKKERPYLDYLFYFDDYDLLKDVVDDSRLKDFVIRYARHYPVIAEKLARHHLIDNVAELAITYLPTIPLFFANYVTSAELKSLCKDDVCRYCVDVWEENAKLDKSFRQVERSKTLLYRKFIIKEPTKYNIVPIRLQLKQK